MDTAQETCAAILMEDSHHFHQGLSDAHSFIWTYWNNNVESREPDRRKLKVVLFAMSHDLNVVRLSFQVSLLLYSFAVFEWPGVISPPKTRSNGMKAQYILLFQAAWVHTDQG